MSDRYEMARAERNWLERLAEKIPGFAGFKDRELRRDTDKLEREQLAQSLAAVRASLRSKARAFTDAGQLAALGEFDRLEKRLDTLAQSIRFADYGATGFFDAVKIDEQDLARLYQFDLSFVAEVEALAGAVRELPGPGGAEIGPALGAIAEHLARLGEAWAGRENVVTGTLGA
ncbi:MAG TPA: hypothetical protein PK413_10830 [Thermoanaerobaculia bacterium]|nr:hypothetical protein [Thermoanaerobaculia bacterium]